MEIYLEKDRNNYVGRSKPFVSEQIEWKGASKGIVLSDVPRIIL